MSECCKTPRIISANPFFIDRAKTVWSAYCPVCEKFLPWYPPIYTKEEAQAAWDKMIKKAEGESDGA